MSPWSHTIYHLYATPRGHRSLSPCRLPSLFWWFTTLPCLWWHTVNKHWPCVGQTESPHSWHQTTDATKPTEDEWQQNWVHSQFGKRPCKPTITISEDQILPSATAHKLCVLSNPIPASYCYAIETREFITGTTEISGFHTYIIHSSMSSLTQFQ